MILLLEDGFSSVMDCDPFEVCHHDRAGNVAEDEREDHSGNASGQSREAILLIDYLCRGKLEPVQLVNLTS